MRACRPIVMLPREHGAYGQLLFPMATALAIGRPGAAAWALAAAAVCAFLAHEPLLVLLGQRGAKVRREQAAIAWRWFGATAVAAIVCGTVALALIPPTARIAFVASAVLAVGVIVAILGGHEHTAGGEILAAAMLSSLGCPLALAAGAPLPAAVTCAATFAAVFVAASVSVHAVIMYTRQPPAFASRVVSGLVAIAAIVCLAGLTEIGYAERAGLWATLPVIGVSIVLVIAPPSARHLRRVGWTLMGATTATAISLVVGLR